MHSLSGNNFKTVICLESSKCRAVEKNKFPNAPNIKISEQMISLGSFFIAPYPHNDYDPLQVIRLTRFLLEYFQAIFANFLA